MTSTARRLRPNGIASDVTRWVPSSRRMLQCTVRECGRPLVRESNRVACSRGHSFDIARSGYINLLQPQDRRSKSPGDTPEAVAARRRLHDLGITAALYEAVAALANVSSSGTVLDVGCGEGYYLGQLQRETKCNAHGVDISIPAIDAAARRYHACEWVVANADRVVPYTDAVFTCILSITGRRPVTEFLRVLQPGGRVLVAIPAEDDLIELRGAGQDRRARTLAEFTPLFRLMEQRRVTSRAQLDGDSIEDLRHAIYRPITIELARAMPITFSLDLLLFEAS
ncbi:MAG: methyltransferase domain-containing protein [Acidobacteriota bacterium]